ncbi:hypothetical protein MMC13_007158 [Lambiella insularis]|nr:hypothetical protein [Lambiella insularis]
MENTDSSVNLQTAFRQAAPKRRKAVKGHETVQIFEDEVERHGQVNGRTKGTALGRIPSNASIRGGQRRDATDADPMRDRLAFSSKQSAIDSNTTWITGGSGRDTRGPLRKESRRHTIYVPSENTTMQTIHAGTSNVDQCHTGRTAQVQADAISRTRRTSLRQSLIAAPKRSPLQHAAKKPQENGASCFGMPGRPTGKENVPPGGKFGGREDSTPKEKASDKTGQSENSAIPTKRASLLRPVRSSPVPVMTSNMYGRGLLQQTLKQSRACSGSYPVENHNSYRLSEEVLKPVVKLSGRKVAEHALFEEDILYPEMFEDTWLRNQEIENTGLVNNPFETATPTTARHKPDLPSSRHKLMQLYQQPSMLFLYQRLHASLQYAALRPSKDSIMGTCRLFNDIGIHRRFVDLWTKTYNVELLRSGVEIVIGRESACAGNPLPRSKASAFRNLELFIESRLLRNDDALRPARLDSSSEAWSWRPTVEGIASLAEIIRPEDLVDGHRERTMILLWGLVGVWSLKTLIDRNDLQYEIGRPESIHDDTIKVCKRVESISSPSQSNKQLLRAWARAVTHRHSLKVRNFTTSFADSKFFGYLVDECHH